MRKPIWIVVVLLGGLWQVASAASPTAVSDVYKALKCPLPASAGTWAVLDRDGANRQVDRYLSSLRFGEAGTGAIVSPPFRVATDTITLSIRGHDGPKGGAKKNYIALVDVRSGKPVVQAFAPGSDELREIAWNVARQRGREVRIEVHDGDSGTAFAWLGIGRIDAGAALNVDFRNGIPPGWQERSQRAEGHKETLAGGVPFLRDRNAYTIVPTVGVQEISCGFVAERLFFLGGTVTDGKPLQTCGTIDIVYRDGAIDRIPLLYGFTLDRAHKMLGNSPAMHLHASSDPFQHYFVVAPKARVIEKIALRRDPAGGATPRITAVTCQTQATGENLQTLPASEPGEQERAWIQSHTIAPEKPDRSALETAIRRAHKM
jgi:hypothetical protein